MTDYTRIINTSQSSSLSWEKESRLLLNTYPKHNITLYSCRPHYQAHKRYLVYLLRFNNQSDAQEKKIGMKQHDCHLPGEKKLYPTIFQQKSTDFIFVDLSLASSEALKQASWSAITTEDVFHSTVDWWK